MTINDAKKELITFRLGEASGTVSVEPLSGLTLEAFLEYRMSVDRSLPDYQEISRSKLMLAGNLPAYAIVDKYTARTSGAPWQGLIVLTVKNDRRFMISAFVNPACWELYHSQFEQIAYSLKVE